MEGNLFISVFGKFLQYIDEKWKKKKKTHARVRLNHHYSHEFMGLGRNKKEESEFTMKIFFGVIRVRKLGFYWNLVSMEPKIPLEP